MPNHFRWISHRLTINIQDANCKGKFFFKVGQAQFNLFELCWTAVVALFVCIMFWLISYFFIYIPHTF